MEPREGTGDPRPHRGGRGARRAAGPSARKPGKDGPPGSRLPATGASRDAAREAREDARNAPGPRRRRDAGEAGRRRRAQRRYRRRYRSPSRRQRPRRPRPQAARPPSEDDRRDGASHRQGDVLRPPHDLPEIGRRPHRPGTLTCTLTRAGRTSVRRKRVCGAEAPPTHRRESYLWHAAPRRQNSMRHLMSTPTLPNCWLSCPASGPLRLS
jgi:hypothetical protein